MWNEFHANPRISYYLALRRGYVYSATEALAKLRSVDVMVVRLEHLGPKPTLRTHLKVLFCKFTHRLTRSLVLQRSAGVQRLH